MSTINDIELSSESDELYHPNIDHKSLINYKRAQKQQKKERKQKQLEHLIETNGSMKEIEKLKFELSEKITVNEERIVFGTNKNSYNEECIADDILYLVNHRSISDFVNFMDEKNVCLEILEDNVLYNLSECIKGANDELGLILAKISLYIKCVKADNGKAIRRMAMGVEKTMSEALENECRVYYAEAKQAIMKLNSMKDKN